MSRFACQYAVIRFLPYAETGEFANVGVVLACPETGFLDARLMPARKTARIRGFFEQLDLRIYREALKYLDEDLERARNQARALHDPDAVRRLFEGVTRPREALLRFGGTRAVMANAPEAMLDALFTRLVERDFANKEYHDQMLERGVREVLQRANLRELFVKAEIGNENLHIQLPFVHTREERHLLAIKPLNLAKDEANRVYETGGQWLARVDRFRKHGLLPDQMLFAVNYPASANERGRAAAKEIAGELGQRAGVQVVAADDTAAIADFAVAATH